MATVNGVLSPPPQQTSFESANNDAITLSAKRKRDAESIEVQPNVNGSSDSKEPEPVALSLEESQSLVQDLVDVLKP